MSSQNFADKLGQNKAGCWNSQQALGHLQGTGWTWPCLYCSTLANGNLVLNLTINIQPPPFWRTWSWAQACPHVWTWRMGRTAKILLFYSLWAFYWPLVSLGLWKIHKNSGHSKSCAAAAAAVGSVQGVLKAVVATYCHCCWFIYWYLWQRQSIVLQ